MFVSDFGAVVYGVNMLFTPENAHDLSTESEMDRVAGFLASVVTDEDLVIASPQLAWAYPSRKADFAQALAAQEKTAEVLPQLSPNRFEYNSAIDSADFVVIDPLAAGLAMKIMPALEEVIDEVRTWPIVYSEGGIQVYRNPNK